VDDFDQLTLSLTRDLIARPSVSPEDGDCQKLLADHLTAMGFNVEALPFGDVANFWATRPGDQQAPILAFAGHTDVVPPGPSSEWHSNPFEPVETDGMLHGRGAADMKGSLAAMITGIQRFLSRHETYRGTIALLITSDEEADAVNGTVKVMQELARRGTTIDWCVVGEPSSSNRVGDVIRVGRRGSLNATLTVNGIQGHVAYPDDARNPIHDAMAALDSLTREVWDGGNAFFPPTSMQISNMHSGTGATNVIPGSLVASFNFRFSTESTDESLKHRTEQILDQHGLDYSIDWALSGQPFITVDGELIPAIQASLRQLLNVETELSTSGGTSDGRFIAPTGTQVAELGPCNATIHKVNECVKINDLMALSRVYTDIMERLLVVK
jgi:succinyl-diaminopimelate desuccinylase